MDLNSRIEVAKLTWKADQLRDLHRDLEARYSDLDHSYSSLLESLSWKITRPLRFILNILLKAKTLVVGTLAMFTRSKITRQNFANAIALYRQAGFLSVAKAIAFELSRPTSLRNSTAQKLSAESLYSVRDIWVNEFTRKDFPAAAEPITVALHLHFYYQDQFDTVVLHLKNLPKGSALYISMPTGQAQTERDWERRFAAQLSEVGLVEVRFVENRGRDLAPLFFEFREKLLKYDVVGHVHTKKSPHVAFGEVWNEALWAGLLGEPNNKESKANLLALLAQLVAEGGVAYPEAPRVYIEEPSGWATNYLQAATLFGKLFKNSNLNSGLVEFPRGSMFWSTRAALQAFLSLPITLEEIPEEPIGADGTILHAIERLVLATAKEAGLKNLKIKSQNFDLNQHFYEPRVDYSEKLEPYTGPHVYSYYLPQFHVTKENSEWHGEDFTEWHKVKGAQPLFSGHYQQHVPHGDIGYYSLDDPQMLRKQAQMMRQAGVDGQIFYHYWFGGKVILDKPIKLLVANQDIEMPFAFCWANENWTRRWDGNDEDVLMAQSYSEADALSFIEHLIPYFEDRRYMHRAGRPLLLVYRPAHNPLMSKYVEIWTQRCIQLGVPVPLVVAVMTRGTDEPSSYGMEAGAERVLTDWALGKLPDRKELLPMYEQVGADVLDYDDVFRHYAVDRRTESFDVIPGIVPVWDNTARYGKNAHLLTNCSPGVFEKWLSNCLERALLNREEHQFVIVNAWNEWAEGAHLEPDLRFGYAFLNRVARAKLKFKS